VNPTLLQRAKAKASKRLSSLDKMVEKSRKVSDYDVSRKTKDMLSNLDSEIADIY